MLTAHRFGNVNLSVLIYSSDVQRTLLMQRGSCMQMKSRAFPRQETQVSIKISQRVCNDAQHITVEYTNGRHQQRCSSASVTHLTRFALGKQSRPTTKQNGIGCEMNIVTKDNDYTRKRTDSTDDDSVAQCTDIVKL